jgi:hypothetical protein
MPVRWAGFSAVPAPDTGGGRREVADSTVMRRSGKPQLITDAERSVEEELRFREIRYVIMMSLRAVCVIVGAILVSVHAPWLPLWLTLCVAGAVVLPWTAVLLANDRAPRPEKRLRNRFHRNTGPSTLPVPRSLSESPDEAPPKVIDVEP